LAWKLQEKLWPAFRSGALVVEHKAPFFLAMLVHAIMSEGGEEVAAKILAIEASEEEEELVRLAQPYNELPLERRLLLTALFHPGMLVFHAAKFRLTAAIVPRQKADEAGFLPGFLHLVQWFDEGKVLLPKPGAEELPRFEKPGPWGEWGLPEQKAD